MDNFYYVIFSNSSRNNGGLKLQCSLMSQSEIIDSASFELNRQGLSFEDLAGIEYYEDESGDFTYARELTEPEAFNFAVAKLEDDGRMFEIYTDSVDFLQNAEDFGIFEQAQQLTT